MASAMSCEQEEVLPCRAVLMCRQQDGFFFSGTVAAEAQLRCDQTQQVVSLQQLRGRAALFGHCKRLQEGHHLHNL